MTRTATDTAITRVSQLPSISLDELNDAASLQMRVDRKYIVTYEDLLAMIDALATRLAALEIDGQRAFGYESVYFDTPGFDSYLSAAYRRRSRFKVRTRSYVESGVTMLEVKTRGTRDVTVKNRLEYGYDNRAIVVPDCHAFVDSATGVVGLGARLSPVLMTEYERITLVDLDEIARLTVDANVRWTGWNGEQTQLGTSYVVETKTTGQPSTADRWLWRRGIRPAKISKFGTGLAVLNPDLPSNKWHRTINRHFAGRRPAPTASNTADLDSTGLPLTSAFP